MKRAIMMAAVLTMGLSRGVLAQAGGPPMVSGRVFDDTTGCPLRGATVSATGSPARTMTDMNGRYYLKGVPTTAFTLAAALLGYATQTTGNVMVADSAVRVDFSLLRAPSDSSVKAKIRYPAATCVLDRKDSGGRYDRR